MNGQRALEHAAGTAEIAEGLGRDGEVVEIDADERMVRAVGRFDDPDGALPQRAALFDVA